MTQGIEGTSRGMSYS